MATGIYPLAVNFPTVGPGLTPRSMKSAAKQFIRDELAMTAQREADKLDMKKSSKASRKLRATETDISDELLEDVFEGDDGAVVGEEGSDFADLDDEDDEDADDNLDDSDGEEDISDEDDEVSDEDEDDISDEDDEDEENMSDDEDTTLDEEEEEEEKVVVAPRPIAKVHNFSSQFSSVNVIINIVIRLFQE